MGGRDREDLEPGTERKHVEPEPAKGSRSLAQWQNLARVRRSLAGNETAQAEYRLDPTAFMQRHGIDMAGAVPAQASESRIRLGIEAMDHSAETQLAFCKVWGCVIVVAGAVANGVAISNAVAVANANLTANVNGMDTGEDGGDASVPGGDMPDGGLPPGGAPDYDSGDGGV